MGGRQTKEAEMQVRRTFALLLTLGLTVAAIAAVSGQAANRPDDRSGPLGVGQATAAVGDDVVARYVNNHPAAVRPDDRSGIRGVGSDVVSRYVDNHPAAVRPDDRGGIRGVGTGTAGI